MTGAAPSWEEIVNQVTIAGDYARVSQAAQHWQAAFARVSELRESLRDLSRRSEVWRGGGGNAFRDHVAAQERALDRTVHDHERIARGLAECARHLETAVKKIPIPSWMYADVLRKRQDYATSQALDGVAPNEFWTTWVAGLRQNPDTSVVERALRAGEEFFANWENAAQQAYVELRQNYARELAGMPQGTRVDAPGVDEAMLARLAQATADLRSGGEQTSERPATPGGPATPPGGTAGNAGSPGSGLPDPAGMPEFPGGGLGSGSGAGGIGSDYPSVDHPGVDHPGSGLPTDGIPSTGLESGARLAGGGGFGGGGFGGGGFPIGPAVSVPPAVMAEATGPATGAAGYTTSRGAAGLSGGGMGMGMVPMGGAAAGAGDRVGTDTWLKEDEDVFGPDTSAASGVLD